MPQVENPGRYLGHILRSKVDKSKNGCIQFVARLRLSKEYCAESGLWIDIMSAEITAYLILTTLRGKPNVQQVEAIMSALDWSGESIRELHEGDWTSPELSVTVDLDTDLDGVKRAVVSWINPVGGFRPTPPEVLDEIETQWDRIAW